VSTDELKELLSSYVARRVASKLVAPPSPRRTDEARAELERAVALCGNTRERAVLRRKVTHIVNYGSRRLSGNATSLRLITVTLS
jgi:predicted RNA polymerase sigma factor